MVAGEHADVLAAFKIFGADGTGETFVDVSNWVCYLTLGVNVCCCVFLLDRVLLGGRRYRGINIGRLGIFARFNLGIWSNLAAIPCQLDVVWLWFIALTELDYRNGVEHGPSQSSGSTLSLSPCDITRTVPLGMPVGSKGTSDDDNEEKRSYDSSDAVEDDHSDSGRRRRCWRITAARTVARGL
jgi:hypothetical protein